ncbi:MAG TPA: DUF4149 domain-containing protein [Pyrinomonadaceae bacterium]|nr:DUF4149 domain-containing protein [Pyrinomonadaceae bacterium]
MSPIKLINYFRLLILGMWLGAAVFFSAIVAPSAFAVLRSYQSFNAGEIAGALVNRNLAAINLSGFVVGLVLLVSAFVRFRKVPLLSFLIEMISVTVLSLATALGNWIIAPKIRALRVTLSTPIDQLSLSDPRRVSFDNLHAYSVRALSVAMIAALLGLVMIALRARHDAK